MKIKKILVLLTAFALTCSACSCTLRGTKSNSENSIKSDSSEKDSEKNSDSDSWDETNSQTGASSGFCPVKESNRLNPVREHTSDLMTHLKDGSNENKLEKDIDALLSDFDELYEEYTSLTIPHYLDFENEELEAEADDAYEDLTIAAELITLAFVRGCESESYSHLFTGLFADNKVIEDYSDPTLTPARLEGYMRVESWIRDERLDRFYDAAYDDDMDDDEKNLKCAEILLEILNEYDTETFYKQYYRDYTPEDIMELADIVKDEMTPVSEEILKGIRKMDNGLDIVTNPKEFDNPFETIAEYAPKLSPEIGAAAEKLLEDKEYSITDGDGSYNGSFTTYLPVSKKGVIYITDNHDYYSLLTPVHEFGHYYAQTYDHIPIYLSASNLDIAEIQSQGFECIFTRFYDDIFEDQADAMLAAKSYDLVYAVLSGFAVGEFEYTVLLNADTFTPEDVVDCWDEITADSMPGIELYMINHVFESPGYYISYAVSALAAFDIWEDCISNPDKALEKYQKIAEISYNDNNYAFRSATKKAGFSDVLNKEYIRGLADELMNYAEKIY